MKSKYIIKVELDGHKTVETSATTIDEAIQALIAAHKIQEATKEAVYGKAKTPYDAISGSFDDLMRLTKNV